MIFDLDYYDNKFDYAICQSKFIQDNHENFVKFAELSHQRFKKIFPGASSTSFYRYYNLMALTFGSVEYYNFYQSLKKVIRHYTNRKDPLWFQTWLNFHNQNEVLKRHNHEGFICHGYVSIDPKNTVTVFDDYTISNKIGQLYIGPGDRFHSVEVLEPYTGPRITIAFDVLDLNGVKKAFEQHGIDDVNVSFLPVD